MIAPEVRHVTARSRHAAKRFRWRRSVLPIAALCAADCGARVIDAVDLDTVSDGATPPSPGQATDGQAPDGQAPDNQGTDRGADSMALSRNGPAPKTDVVWPNPSSSANSSPWLVTHHDKITVMRPNVLVLDFYNRESLDQDKLKVQERIDAIAEGSRYHGYSDSNAPPFLIYSPRYVDLTDHPPSANWPYVSSMALPVNPNDGAFDPRALFSQSFASRYDFPDPNDSSRYLTLCELFERGIINELWLSVGDNARTQPRLFMESKQEYDAENRLEPGMFNSCTGYVCLPPSMPHCTVTARIAVLDPTRGPGCDLVPRSINVENMSINVENMRPAIQYLGDNGSDFFNHNFKSRYATDFDSWGELVALGAFPWCTSYGPACIGYSSETAAKGTYPDAGTWKIDPFVQGCGSAHFPPNAQFEWDYSNSTPVQSRCENYAMQNGVDGSDRADVYTSAKETASASALPTGDDCYGGWQIYLSQSMPGLNNAARDVAGAPMKNWWPFLFY